MQSNLVSSSLLLPVLRKQANLLPPTVTYLQMAPWLSGISRHHKAVGLNPVRGLLASRLDHPVYLMIRIAVNLGPLGQGLRLLPEADAQLGCILCDNKGPGPGLYL